MAPRDEGQILVTGSLAFDHIMDFPGYFKDHILPDKIHTINLSFLVGDLRKQRGGCAANIAYSLALLGRDPRIVAAAGHDFDDYAEWLREEGIDIGGLHRFDDVVTASCFITTDRADNQITGFYPGAMGRAGEISLAESAGESPAICIVAPDDPAAMLRHCREAKTAGIPLVFDPSFQVIHLEGDQLWEALRGSRMVVLNDYEYAVLREKTGRDEAAILTETEILVVTLGEKGSSIRTRAGGMRIPSVPVSEVVDPTGAGDAYRAGFLAGLVTGHPLETCGRLGAVAAAYAVENYGTQAHRYTREEFAARYEKAFGEAPEL